MKSLLARKILIGVALLGLWSRSVQAIEYTFRLGPATVGRGGSNPLSIPPTNVQDWELGWVTKRDFIFRISIFPMLLSGGYKKSYRWGCFNTYGMGVLLNPTFGLGAGAFTSFGYNIGCFSKNWCVDIEYHQVIGITETKDIVSPYALRIGLLWER